jgi:sugar-phosphatase
MVSVHAFEVDAVLFDLDGVMVRSERAIERAWKKWAKKRGVPWASLRSHIHGRLAIETIHAVLPDVPMELALQDAEEVMALQVGDARGCRPVPGVKKLLSALRPENWAIVTGCSPDMASSRLTAANYPLPDTLITCRDVKKGKPDPEGYRLAAERLNAECGRCLVLEDSPPGIVAAQRAGMAVIAFTTTHHIDALGAPDATVPDARHLRIRQGSNGKVIVETD